MLSTFKNLLIMPPKWSNKNSKEVFNEEEFAYEKFKLVQLNK